MTKRATSGPLGTFCHHVVTKCAGVTKRAGGASNLTFCHLSDKACRNKARTLAFVFLDFLHGGVRRSA